MQCLEIALNEVVSDFEKLVKDIPDMRRELHTHLGKMMDTQLRINIYESLNGDVGKIIDMQHTVVGSGGGYAATRAVSGQSGRANSPGAITNYLESGHRIRPRGTAPGYRPRIKVSGAYVSGRHFYAKTAANIEPILIAAAEAFCDKLAKRIEGGG
ncbi:MAG: hypothetical protein RSA62_05795 [Oscillospiraceae bacterium]